MQEAECVGYSREYLAEEEGFDLADLTVREAFRNAVEKSFGVATLDEIGVVYRKNNNDGTECKAYEAFIRVFSNVKEISYEALSGLKVVYPNAFIENVKPRKETGLLEVEIVIARCWAEPIDGKWAKANGR